MEKRMVKFLSIISVLSMIFIISSAPAENNVSSYAEDRAQIEDLQARYMFALDFRDLDTYASTFTEDGILDIVGMKWQGREEIKKVLANMASPEDEATPDNEEAPVTQEEGDVKEEKALYPATGRHNITNIAIKINGDRATGRAYWFHYGNDNPERKAVLNSYGYYEDEMVKVNGQWLFSKRVIYNEQVAEWIGSSENPCW